jgi:SAM-dependent methyltransferase
MAHVVHNYFDHRVAARYDADAAAMFDPATVEATVEFLAELAGSRDALELGIGTGRIALPLSARGVRVAGIDLSEDMVARLRAKPGAESIEVTIGDFADASVGRSFGLAYLIFNTITNLTTQEAQVACFQNVARHLAPGGRFVIECYIPELRRLPPGEVIHPFDITATHLGFEEYDFATQIAFSHHYWLEHGTLETFSAPFRYVWPSELDLMARLAGMSLRERWAGWTREPFTSESRSHVSIWEAAA